MKDLERATGVGRESIRYYIREGLLPEPERPGRNVAWYDDSFVERIRLIKELQQKRFLPLHVIKAIVGNDATPPRDEVQTLLQLDGKLFPAVDGAPQPEPERLSAVARRTGLTAAEVHELADVGLVELTTHKGDHWLDQHGVALIELWAKMRAAGYREELGFGPANLRVYLDFVQWLAREELRLFSHGVTGKVDTETSVQMAESGINLMNQMIGMLRRATLLRYIAQGNVPEPASSHPAARSAPTG